jgi:hypothetical protein
MPATLDPADAKKREDFTTTLCLNLAKAGLLSLTDQTMSWDVSYGRYTWQVAKALDVVERIPHRLRPIPKHQLAHIAAICTVEPAHVQTVNPANPGIVAMYFDLEVRCWQGVVIDGNHRAVRAHQTGARFQCYELTPVESWALLLEHPVAGESVFYAEHLCCPPDCMVQIDADTPRVS